LKYFIYIISFLSVTSAFAQKRLSQTFDATQVKELYIDSNEIFEIRVTTANTDQISIHTIIDGETFESTLLTAIIENQVLKVTTNKTPDYIPFNDKLSAHKVIAIELEIVIPNGMMLSVYSTLASLEVKGVLGRTRIDLGRGNFAGRELRFRESVTINTISGNVDMDITNAHITAQSRKGKVVIPKSFTSGTPISIQSLHGDITVRKSL